MQEAIVKHKFHNSLPYTNLVFLLVLVSLWLKCFTFAKCLIPFCFIVMMLIADGAMVLVM